MRARSAATAVVGALAALATLGAPAAAQGTYCTVEAPGWSCEFRCEAFEQIVLMVGRHQPGSLQGSVTCGTYAGFCNIESTTEDGFCLAAGFSVVDGVGHCRLGAGDGAGCGSYPVPPGLLTPVLDGRFLTAPPAAATSTRG